MPHRLPRVLGPVLALSALLVTAACGGDDPTTGSATGGTPSATPTALPTGEVELPEGTELTEPGTALEFGEPATVAYQVGRDAGSVVELDVLGARQGRVRDLAAFQLDDATRAATPYYVRVKVTNVGTGDVGGAAVPLYAVDANDTLVQASSFTTGFERCPSTPLPETFGPDDETTTCLVYLLQQRGTLEAVSYRPQQSFEGITWTGDVVPAGRGRS